MFRLVVPAKPFFHTMQNYALNNSLEDVDEVTEALRQLHREYQRRQFGAFRQMVAKAIRVVESKGDAGGAKPEIKLQVTLCLMLACQPSPCAHGHFNHMPPCTHHVCLIAMHNNSGDGAKTYCQTKRF